MASRRKRVSRVVSPVPAAGAPSPASPESLPGTVRYLRWVIASILALAAVYVMLALSPSHYSIALNKLGVPTEPLWGTARQVRSDEWMVVTPLTQIALKGNFNPRNQISPYGESLHGFIALPINDWSMAFKPQLWAYWFLPPAYAFSLYWAILWTSMLFGYALLLRRFAVPWSLALLGSAVLWMSQYVQVWWTGPGPCFAFAPWPLVFFLSRSTPWIRWTGFAYASSVWIFSAVYPPFLVSSAFAFLFLALAFDRSAFTPRAVLSAVGVAALVMGVVILNLYETVEAMRSTVYPGARESQGGGVAPLRLIAYLLPFISTAGFRSLVPRLDECEVSVVSTLLPLLLLVFVDHSSAIRHIRSRPWAVWVTVGGLGLMLAWIALPIPAQVGKLLLWHLVPPYRMTWAFGLLLTLALVIAVSRMDVKVTAPRTVIFCSIMLLSWLASRGVAIELSQSTNIRPISPGWFDFAAIAVAAAGFAMIRFRRLGSSIAAQRIYLLGVAAGTGVVTFGTYNPVQRSHVVFNIPDSRVQQEFREQANRNPNGWLVVPGTFGAVLNGAGIPSVTHTLTTPQLAFFKAVFPELPQSDFNNIFNRYGHTMMRREPSPRLLHQDIMGVPIEAFERSQPEAKRIGEIARQTPGSDSGVE